MYDTASETSYISSFVIDNNRMESFCQHLKDCLFVGVAQDVCGVCLCVCVWLVNEWPLK